MQPGKKTKAIPAAALLSPEQKTSLLALLDACKTLAPEAVVAQVTSPAMAQALAERLVADDPATPSLLGLLSRAFAQKGVQKAVRKAVFKMKQKGMAVPGELERDPGGPVLKQPSEGLESLAFLGPIDRLGNRGVLVALPNTAIGYDAGFGAVGDTEGFVFFATGSYGRKQTRELQSAFLDAFGGDQVVPVSLSHALAILEKAYGLGKDAPTPYLRRYLELRPRLMEMAEPLHSPAIYQCIPPSEVHEEALTPSRLERLMGHALLASWTLDPQKLAPLMSEIKAIETSPLFLTEHQKLGRIEEIEEKWIRDSFDTSERRILKTRLEETAYLLFHGNERELSRLCLNAARSLDSADGPFATNAFLKFLLDRSLGLLETIDQKPDGQETGEGPSNSPLILP